MQYSYISIQILQQINKKLISLIRLSGQSTRMFQDAKKSASVLWKKLNIENKQPATKRASSYPNAHQNQDQNQEFLEGLTSQNEFAMQNKEINDVMDQIQKTGAPKQSHKNVKTEDWHSNQRKDSINSNNQQQNESVTYSIVQKLKMDEDSKIVSQAQNLSQINRLTKPNLICNMYESKILLIKKDLRQLRNNIKNIQDLFYYEKNKIMQEFTLFFTKNLTQFLNTHNIRKSNNGVIIQNLLQQSPNKQLILQKQWQIKKLMQELQQSRQQNIQLTQKIFDLNQKIYQNDLQTEKKIKALMSFNPRNWETSNINTQSVQVNFGEHKINSIQNSRSNKQYSQNIEKIGQNLDKLTQKVEKLQKGQEIILSQLSQIDKGRIQLTRQMIKVKAKQKQLIHIQQLMEAKLSRITKLQNEFKNDQFDRQTKVQLDKSNQKSRGERIKTQSDNPYISNTPKIQKQWSPKYKKMSEVFNKNYKSKPQTPKVQANVYRHHNVLQANSSANQLSYGFNGSKVNSPKAQLSFHKGFNSSYQQNLSNILAKPNRVQVIQNNQIEKLGARIDQLRNQIKKQINASK